MFGLKSKKAAKIKELEERLVALATKVEENNHDIGEIKGDIADSHKTLTAKIQGLGAVITELQRRQNVLRLALSEGLNNNE